MHRFLLVAVLAVLFAGVHSTTAATVAPSVLKVESDPPGATITVDGKQQWIAPIEMELPAGVHLLKLHLKGYRDSERSVDLKAGETSILSVPMELLPAPSPSGPSMLKVQSTPTGATVVVDGYQKWIAPIEMELPAGKHTLRFTLKGYRDVVKSIVLEGGESSTVSASLEPLPGKNKSVVAGVLLLALMAIVIVVATLRRKRVATPQRNVQTSEDTPTAELRFDTVDSTPGRTPTPLDQRAIEAIRSKARELPGGVPDELGGYELVGMLGRGGMGTTFLAKRKRDGMALAVKVPHDHLLDNSEFIKRFLREGALGTTLHHPHIIRILEAGQVANRPFIVMELLHGETLEALLKQKDHLPVLYSLEIARAIAVALDYARLKGVVHRDLKPENIMILEHGGLKVMDFGIARIMDSAVLTSSEAYLGTPSYSAPESTGGRVDQQSDLYSLGIILYRMLSGQVPFYSKDPLEILEMHRTQSLPPFPDELKIPSEVFRLVQKLTAKKKFDRYANAESFLTDLNLVLNQLAA